MILLALAVSSWVRSYWHESSSASLFHHNIRVFDGGWSLRTISGSIQLLYLSNMHTGYFTGPEVDVDDRPVLAGESPFRPYDFSNIRGTVHTFLGIGYVSGNFTSFGTDPYLAFCFPYWLMIIPWALLNLLFFRNTLRIFRQLHGGITAKGNCAKCGYDLRASNRRCPECGLRFHHDPQSIASPANGA